MSFLDKIMATVMPPESDQDRAEARKRAEALASGNGWLAMALEHHRQIESAFARARAGIDAAQRKQAMKELALILTGHAQAEERRHQLLMDLSLNITAMISQRLLPRENKMGRVAAMEIMLASPLISDLIFRGEVAMIKDIMAKSTRLGMQTFDQALFQLYEDGTISYEEALRNADSKNELRLKIKLQSKREGAAASEHGESLQLAEEEKESRF